MKPAIFAFDGNPAELVALFTERGLAFERYRDVPLGQIARQIGVGHPTLTKAVRDGRLPTRRSGSQLFVSAAEVAQLLADGKLTSRHLTPSQILQIASDLGDGVAMFVFEVAGSAELVKLERWFLAQELEYWPLEQMEPLADVAKRLGIDRKMLLQIVKRGQLPAEKLGREWYVLPSAIRQAIVDGRILQRTLTAEEIDRIANELTDDGRDDII